MEKLPESLTVAELREMLDGMDDDTPIYVKTAEQKMVPITGFAVSGNGPDFLLAKGAKFDDPVADDWQESDTPSVK